MPQRTPSRSVDVFVEIPRGSRAKYELDKATARIRLDVVEEPTFPGCIVPARPIGTLLMRDEKGQDEKIIAVPVGDPRFDQVHALEDLAPHWLKEIETFFATYKTLEGGEVELAGWRGADTAWRLIDESRVTGSEAKVSR